MQICTVENKCRRMVNQVYSVFCFGSEHCSWWRAILDRSEGSKTKAVRRLFRFKRKEDELLKEDRMRSARAVRIIWKKMKFLLVSEMINESTWRAMDGPVTQSQMRH